MGTSLVSCEGSCFFWAKRKVEDPRFWWEWCSSFNKDFFLQHLSFLNLYTSALNQSHSKGCPTLPLLPLVPELKKILSASMNHQKKETLCFKSFLDKKDKFHLPRQHCARGFSVRPGILILAPAEGIKDLPVAAGSPMVLSLTDHPWYRYRVAQLAKRCESVQHKCRKKTSCFVMQVTLEVLWQSEARSS